MPKCKESGKHKHSFDVEHGSGNVFKDIGFDDEEAASLLLRAQMMSTLKDILESRGLSQRQAAKILNVAQPRIAEIMGMKTHLFSADLLTKLLTRFGKKVCISIEDSHQVA